MTLGIRPARALAALASMAGSVAPSFAGETLLIPRAWDWKVLVTPVAADPAWNQPGFQDGAWMSAFAILGYGESYINMPLSWGPNPNDKYPTTYFRGRFQVTNPAQHLSFTLRVNFDDGFVCYLNGREILRRKMPSGEITYDTYASSHEGGRYEEFDVPGALEHLVPGTNVIAFEVHQTNRTSPDLVFDAEVATTNVSADLLRGPYLQVGTPDHVTIRWRTATATDSRVTCGLSPGEILTVTDDPAVTTEHEVVVPTLAPDTRHYYTIGSTTAFVAGGDSSYSFRSAPPVGTDRPTRVWVIGDSGEANQNARDVRDAYHAYPGSENTDVWLMLGDNAYDDGTDSQYQNAVFEMYPLFLRDTVLWPARGNHDDIHSGADNDFYDIFTLPTGGEAGGLASGTEEYYSFDFANVHFICLDTQESDMSPGSPMVTWLFQDLVATDQDWVVVYFHHPPYTKGSHDSDDSGDSSGRLFEVRENVVPILEAGGTDLVLAGHSHSYERSFLINGHHGVSSTLEPWMILNGGDGRIDGDGAYLKETLGTGPQEGTLYAVAGSSSKHSGGDLDHPVMYTSLDVLGSLVLDVDGDELHGTFIDDTGAVLDWFSIRKGVATDSGGTGTGPQGRLDLRVVPNPFTTETRLDWAIPSAGRVDVSVFDAAGRRVKTLVHDELPTGRHSTSWNGRDSRGGVVGPGVYFTRLVHQGQTRTRKLVLLR